MGIDLGGPLYTPVYAFWHGTVHAAGYNAELGDYGHVIVIRHTLTLPLTTTSLEKLPKEEEVDESTERPARTNPDDPPDGNQRTVVIYALYGHLDKDSTRRFHTRGQPVRRGELLGRMGDIHENGGWFGPHVHFQLSVQPPETHDLPGAVRPGDRHEALWNYPDPRCILGPIY